MFINELKNQISNLIQTVETQQKQIQNLQHSNGVNINEKINENEHEIENKMDNNDNLEYKIKLTKINITNRMKKEKIYDKSNGIKIVSFSIAYSKTRIIVATYCDPKVKPALLLSYMILYFW